MALNCKPFFLNKEKIMAKSINRREFNKLMLA
ncbi:uncharacterized protein METZ01_LOCUS494623, partial [marine metagenome]